MWAPALSQGAPALPRRPSPPCSLSSRSSPSRRPAPSPAPFLLSLVLLSSRSRPRPRSYPRHFLIFSYLITWYPARYSHAIRALIFAELVLFRTFFNNKITVINLLIPRFNSYKVIFVSLFFLISLIFRFVFYTTLTRALFPISFY